MKIKKRLSHFETASFGLIYICFAIFFLDCCCDIL